MAGTKDLTKHEIDIFLETNLHGILSMVGKKPYGLPMGYYYKKKTILLGLMPTGRKMKYLDASKNICFTICKPRWETDKLKTSCTSIVIEGSLKELKNKEKAIAFYDLKSEIFDDIKEMIKLYKINVNTMGARKCTRKPCELLTNKTLMKRVALSKPGVSAPEE
jgi:nitroimidazol reductase NimA-like FMN-containing flavoprotein (pyridoxamine 5'-phosphate oxidase superfamily)